MRIRIDEEECAGYGICEELAPELFEVDELGVAVLKLDGELPPEAEGRARQAIAECPMRAIIEQGVESE
jgi:ferredoxin